MHKKHLTDRSKLSLHVMHYFVCSFCSFFIPLEKSTEQLRRNFGNELNTNCLNIISTEEIRKKPLLGFASSILNS